MSKELLIIGIDPGITTAYAVLDASGNILKLKSAKKLVLSNLVKEILEIDGKIIAVGSDVKYPPHYVEKFCSAFNAKLIRPHEDMKIGFKERITAQHKTNDDHQRDALAAAIFAYNELKPLFEKVNRQLKALGKEHLAADVKELAIHGWNIADALEQLEKKDESPVTAKKRIKKKVSRSSKIFYENLMLKEENRRLLSQLEFLRKKIEMLKANLHHTVNAQIHETLKLKDKKIASLNRAIGELQKTATDLRNKSAQLTGLILETDNKTILKRFKNLGKEIIPQLGENECIYVDDPTSASEATLEYLQRNNVRVLSRQKSSRSWSIDATKLHIEDYNEFVAVDRDELERAKSSHDLLFKIVKEYRESRE